MYRQTVLMNVDGNTTPNSQKVTHTQRPERKNGHTNCGPATQWIIRPQKGRGFWDSRNVGELLQHRLRTRPDRKGHTARDSFHTEHPAEAESSQATARPGQGWQGGRAAWLWGLSKEETL